MGTALKTRELAGYGVADAGQAMIGTLIGFYQLYFFTDVMRLPLASVAALFLLTKIVDSASYPLFGILVDRAARAGQTRRWLAWLILPYFVTSILLFTFNPDWDVETRVAYTYCIVSLFVVISALLSVVYAALVSSIASQASDRARLSTMRFVFAFGASTMATFTIKYLVDYFGGNQTGGYYYVALIFSAVAALALYITYASTTERVVASPPGQGEARINMRDIIAGMVILFRTRAFLAPIIATVFTGLFVTVKSQTTLYFITHVMRRADISNILLASGTVSCALGVGLVGLVINRIDRYKLFMGLMAGNALFIGLIYFIGLADTTLILICHCLNSLLGGACAPVMFSIYSDVVDHVHHTKGCRSPALINSVAMLSGRLGGSIGMVLTPLGLAWFQYRPDAVQSAAAAHGITLMFTLIPAAFALAAAAAMVLYRITNQQAQDTSHQLASGNAQWA
jgi:GPH family glycoside/pentoside/hexuronide:cation symporter